MAEIILITGEPGSGKTSLCHELVTIAQKKGLELGGLISPPVFEGDEKTGINVLHLKTLSKYKLAELNDGQDHTLQTKRWAFDPKIVEWGNRALAGATPCDLLIIDELGPLEFEREQGWTNGIQAVSGQAYKAALVVVRPSLLEHALQLWPVSRVIDLAKEDQDPKKLFDSLGLD
jgi:nucleoside-triphosphatase THEP1